MRWRTSAAPSDGRIAGRTGSVSARGRPGDPATAAGCPLRPCGTAVARGSRPSGRTARTRRRWWADASPAWPEGWAVPSAGRADQLRCRTDCPLLIPCSWCPHLELPAQWFGAVGGRPQLSGSAATNAAEPGNRGDSTSSTLGRSPVEPSRVRRPWPRHVTAIRNVPQIRLARVQDGGDGRERYGLVGKRIECTRGARSLSAWASVPRPRSAGRFRKVELQQPGGVPIDSVSAEMLVSVRSRVGGAAAPTAWEWIRCRSPSHPPWRIPVRSSVIAGCRTLGRGAGGRSIQGRIP